MLKARTNSKGAGCIGIRYISVGEPGNSWRATVGNVSTGTED